ncbi:MAG TPA: deoxyguanosinetriphosphate triphosphohydrolase [Phycisphaerales bacterium]|nr:deoxyguanosinetriphosphate triphosphohydrolase [Phycisphaerales bacterium]
MSDRRTVREQYEARQDAWLAPWAVRERDAGGRACPEDEHPYRTCFQRDRDRIVHCSAFRRLDFKTQVFVPHEHDHYRTRLTHTLEVAQIARDLGRALRANEDLLETVSLAHDLGHPPFGHGGEAALDELMAGHGGFEHNRQSLRVVDYLEHPYPRFRGLNLTRVVRECLAKHETRYDAPVCEEFDPSLRAPLEGQLVDLADEIAYTAADLDDALAAEWISVEQLAELSLWRQAAALAETDAPDAREIHQRIRACKAVLALMADDAIATTADNLRAASAASVDDIRRAPRRLASFSPEMGAAVEQMQQFLLRNVYLARDNAGKERDTHRILGEMFRAFLTDPDRLPQRYRRRIEQDGLHRVLCDYLAGMTDRFCLAEYAKLRS